MRPERQVQELARHQGATLTGAQLQRSRQKELGYPGGQGVVVGWDVSDRRQGARQPKAATPLGEHRVAHLAAQDLADHVEGAALLEVSKPLVRVGTANVLRSSRLRSLFHETVNLDLIREHWDQLVRVAAFCGTARAPAHVVLDRLVASSRSDRLAKALTMLGRSRDSRSWCRLTHATCTTESRFVDGRAERRIA